MVFQRYIILLLVSTSIYGAPASVTDQKQAALVIKEKKEVNNDLKAASSSYSHQYSDWGGRNPGGYGYSVTGFGTIGDKYTTDPLYRGFNGYDNSLKYNSYPAYGNEGNLGYSGYKGSNGYVPSRFGPTALDVNLYGGNEGIGYSGSGSRIGNGIGEYGSSGYGVYGGKGYPSYGGNGYPSYSGNGYSGYGGGYGGYGGYGGNGGLNSYYGYNNPNYQGGGHLGYGYQAKKLGYGNIYSSGITPSLVTGYRGYTRR